MKRRLTTILAADLAGYSRLMAEDEEGVIARLGAARAAVVDVAIAAAEGRIVKTMGDGLLIEFASPVAAVRAALEIQKSMASREAENPEDQRLRFRIGLHLGDVVIDGDDLLGDAVNIAARLESLAPVGGICISRTVMEQIRGRVDAEATSLGPQSVKNIPEPVEVWRLEVEGAISEPMIPGSAVAGSREPVQASIAVLPFRNLSADPEQAFLCEGLVEDVITELGRFRWIFVIARSSTEAYRETNSDHRAVARELGVRYLVEGSVRRSGSRLRVAAQLIDASEGGQVWADRWDRSFDDVFEVQDELTQAIVAGVAPEIGAHERALARRKPTESLSAWELCQRGYTEFARATPEAISEAERLYAASIEADPHFSLPRGLLARLRYFEVRLGLAEDPGATVADGIAEAETALEIDPREEEGHASLALLYGIAGRLAEAVAVADRGIALNPNHPLLRHGRALASLDLGDGQAAVDGARAARRLSPHDPILWAFLTIEAGGLLLRNELGDVEAAEAVALEAVNRNPRVWHPQVIAALAAARRGDATTARKRIKEARGTLPGFGAGTLRHSLGPGASAPLWAEIIEMLDDMGVA